MNKAPGGFDLGCAMLVGVLLVFGTWFVTAAGESGVAQGVGMRSAVCGAGWGVVVAGAFLVVYTIWRAGRR